jgi:hypothetical protein
LDASLSGSDDEEGGRWSQFRRRDGDVYFLAGGEDQLAGEPGVLLAVGGGDVEHVVLVLADRREVAGVAVVDEDVAGGAGQ